MYLCVCVCVNVHVHVHVCVSVCVNIHECVGECVQTSCWFQSVYFWCMCICICVSACPTWWRKKKGPKPQVEQTKRPVCVSGWGIWMASGEAGRLVVTQVTPEVPGEKHIAVVCCGKGALKRHCVKRRHLHYNVFMQLVFLVTPPTSGWR